MARGLCHQVQQIHGAIAACIHTHHGQVVGILQPQLKALRAPNLFIQRAIALAQARGQRLQATGVVPRHAAYRVVQLHIHLNQKTP